MKTVTSTIEYIRTDITVELYEKMPFIFKKLGWVYNYEHKTYAHIFESKIEAREFIQLLKDGGYFEEEGR